MIIAGFLFLLGILIGLSYGYPAIALASLATVVTMPGVWLLRGEFGLFSLLVLVGYLFALQSGFVLGSYLATPGDED